MQTNNSLLSFGRATTNTLSVCMSNATQTSTSLMHFCVVFMCVLLGYSSTLNAQIINTFAGTGGGGSSGDGGLATAASIGSPVALAKDVNGNIYFYDTFSRRVRKVTVSTSIITTICGTGVSGFSGDGGLATAAQTAFIFGIAIDASNNIYLTDSDNYRIRKITASTGYYYYYLWY